MTDSPTTQSLEESIDRLNSLYDEQLKDSEIVLREVPGKPRYRLLIEPVEPAKHQQDFQKGLSEVLNGEQMETFIAGLEAAPDIERRAESEAE